MLIWCPSWKIVPKIRRVFSFWQGLGWYRFDICPPNLKTPTPMALVLHGRCFISWDNIICIMWSGLHHFFENACSHPLWCAFWGADYDGRIKNSKFSKNLLAPATQRIWQLGHSSTDRPGVNIVMSAISIKIATIGQSWALITNIKSVFEYIFSFKNYSLRQFWHLS